MGPTVVVFARGRGRPLTHPPVAVLVFLARAAGAAGVAADLAPGEGIARVKRRGRAAGGAAGGARGEKVGVVLARERVDVAHAHLLGPSLGRHRPTGV